MKLTDRHKICGHCEGRIPQEAVICPYCSHDLSLLNATTRDGASEISASLYSPPYTSNKSPTPSGPTYTTPKQHEPAPPEAEVSVKPFYMPLLFLMAGSNLLLIGLFQLFFAENGKLRLEWDTGYAFLFFILALPLLGVGAWRLKRNKS